MLPSRSKGDYLFYFFHCIPVFNISVLRPIIQFSVLMLFVIVEFAAITLLLAMDTPFKMVVLHPIHVCQYVWVSLYLLLCYLNLIFYENLYPSIIYPKTINNHHLS